MSSKNTRTLIGGGLALTLLFSLLYKPNDNNDQRKEYETNPSQLLRVIKNDPRTKPEPYEVTVHQARREPRLERGQKYSLEVTLDIQDTDCGLSVSEISYYELPKVGRKVSIRYEDNDDIQSFSIPNAPLLRSWQGASYLSIQTPPCNLTAERLGDLVTQAMFARPRYETPPVATADISDTSSGNYETKPIITANAVSQ